MEHLAQQSGGIIGVKLKNTSKKALSFILSFASGLMMSIVCFDLIPEALETSDFGIVITGITFGICVMVICDMLVRKRMPSKKNTLLKTGIAVGIGLTLHNFPEGLAIGSGFEASIKLRILTRNNNFDTRHTRTEYQWQYQ